MANYRCAACAGTYRDPDARGVSYFHQCAPVIDPLTGREVERPGARNENLPRPPPGGGVQGPPNLTGRVLIPAPGGPP